MSPRTSKSTKVSSRTSLTRRGDEKRERGSYLILVEGTTEKGYFSGMRSRRGPQIEVDVIKGDHVTRVRKAVARVSDEYDAVWCVQDTELDQTLTDKMLHEAHMGSKESKDGKKLHLGLSTPCFEFWLILHHDDHRKPFQTADEAKRKLKDILPAWSEGDTRFSDFADGVADACDRARELDREGDDHGRNPSTNVWQLTTLLRADPGRSGPDRP
ncbi:RloB family protein [Streptosporangium sp. NPDC048047]|uniref:RloB family protein n=1 Tax=Streptosporangium sp. NPDC048047 TaxID=3155748 RepID=UPI00341E6FBA